MNRRIMRICADLESSAPGRNGEQLAKRFKARKVSLNAEYDQIRSTRWTPCTSCFYETSKFRELTSEMEDAIRFAATNWRRINIDPSQNTRSISKDASRIQIEHINKIEKVSKNMYKKWTRDATCMSPDSGRRPGRVKRTSKTGHWPFFYRKIIFFPAKLTNREYSANWLN